MTLLSPDLGPGPLDEPGLPEPRGPLTDTLLDRLRRRGHDLGPMPAAGDHPLVGEDAPLALYLCYELHYRGLPGVDEAWEWEPSLLALRRRLEQDVERALLDGTGPIPVGLDTEEVVDALVELSDDSTDDGPSLSAFVAEDASLGQVRELAVHRSPYQLKEADPHTWAIPRLDGIAKATLVRIQAGEYGDGNPGLAHAELFAATMAALGLDPAYGAYLDQVPGVSLTTCNLISLLGLHRRWRGALVGHLALFERCSVTPMARYANAMRRLGFDLAATRFYDEHVLADQVHEDLALEMVRDLVDREPLVGGEVLFGAKALGHVEALFADHALDAFHAGRSSLRRPLAG